MEYPHDFPQHSRNRVEIAKIHRGREFETAFTDLLRAVVSMR
jgi:hypothetical protein